jgi:tetratricopeptide (TPR) repeat protein
MVSTTDVPPRSAVLAQLDRVCAYQRFRNAPILQRILRFLVEQSLLGARLTERTIGDGLKDEPLTPDKDTGVLGYPKTKSNLNHVRGRLMTYYADPANSLDPVIIKMEKRCYVPVIAFNRNAFPAVEVEDAIRRLTLRAKTAIDFRTYGSAIRAIQYWAELIENSSDHYQRWANLTFIPFATAPLVAYASHAIMPFASGLIAHARRSGFNPWECVFVEGCISASRDHEWAQALKLFETAKEGSQRESLYFWWHTALLASMGRIHESIDILDGAVRHFSRTNVATRTDLAMLQIMSGRYADAEETLSSTVDFASADNPLIACSFAILYEAQDRLSDALAATREWTDKVKRLSDPANLPLKDALRVNWHGYLSGMLALIYGRSQEASEAPHLLAGLLGRKAKYQAQSCIEIGIAHIGLKNYGDAVTWLTKAAFEEEDPIAMWYHIFPPLRHLRGHPGFQNLLAKLHLPTHGDR